MCRGVLSKVAQGNAEPSNDKLMVKGCCHAHINPYMAFSLKLFCFCVSSNTVNSGTVPEASGHKHLCIRLELVFISDL